MSQVRVKICGIVRLEDALDAIRLGADALGFNFWPRSKRFCRPSMARKIISEISPLVMPVGVFVNAKRARVERVALATGIRCVQLHGDETPAQCRGFSLPVIKAWQVEDASSLENLRAYPVAALLVDAASRGYGGSGRVFDWSVLREIEWRRPLILAGGLTPANVRRAVRQVKPHAVDVASGVESAPGIKDWKKMARFIAAAKEG